MTHHYVVALTGGVASGKSAVARRFEKLGIGVHDADVAAREVVAAGSTALAEIEFVFGQGMLNADGSLDRRAMRERVFADAGARLKLERIIHPRVRAWLQRRVGLDRGPYCMLAIPLLAENRGDYAWVDRVLLVDAPEALQVERLVQRDGVSREHAAQMLAAQATREQRLAIADDVIVNDGEEAALDAKVATLHARYLELARATRLN
ncbi:MAG: dephospho-CoA kinase [Xanthomonadales bacterium]|nr:dephospho-CoA kinase [Xanthomonadales bacterium]ODU92485.1 MAG: dephospho-CoA kinase [Rhodanobacter sp. SCN 66-43]OJY86538.1 MAG: dephospho-CoA kinase [Xanthomonadales bacterium 66-474]